MKTAKTEEVDPYANPPRCDCEAMDGVPHRHMRGGPEPLTDAELNGLTTGKDGSIEGGAAESTGAADEETEGEVEEVGEDLLEQTAHEVIAAVAGIDDKKVLRMLIKAEGAGKNRSSVLGALENRIAEL